MDGISNTGKKAEGRFLDLLQDQAKKTDNEKRGDAIAIVDGDRHYVEINECGALPGKSGTINQVRPIKYIPCVIYAPNRECWYVIPPHELVKLAADKARGQHTEISFESMTLQLSSLERFRCDESDLWPQVEGAIRSAEKDPPLRDIMNQLLDELRPLLMASQPSC